MATKAAFWIASGKYIPEAARSAESLRRHTPDLPCALISPDVPDDATVEPFEHVVQAPKFESRFWFHRSVFWFTRLHKLLPDYDQLLYLDTDTHVCRPLDDVFALLRRYAFVACHAPGRNTRPNAPDPYDIPDSFPEVNVGVNAFWRGLKQVRLLWELWLAIYERHLDDFGDNDQPALRAALWQHNNLRFYVMPPEYNCRFGFGGFARYHVHVLHGRTHDIEAVEREINAEAVMRGWDRGEYG